MTQNLLSISDLTDQNLQYLVQKTISPANEPLPFDPKKKAVGLIFLESSTRTRVSFERAAQITGRFHIFIEAKGSSVEKGESLGDTLLNLKALGIGIFVIRTPRTGELEDCRTLGVGPIINAGDGTGEHPTQALLDLCTLVRHWGGGRLENMRGLKLGIIGDLRRSRVARSWALLAARLGVKLTLISPAEWRPLDWGADLAWTDKKDEALPGLDVVMALRIQKERMHTLDPEESSQFVENFQLNPDQLEEDQFLMHPGPVNWGVELSSRFKSEPRSLILHQVETGLALRALVLELLDRSGSTP